MRNLKGKRVLVTGGGRGIGRSIAERFAARGADLVIADRQIDTLEQVRGALVAAGRRAWTYELDVTDFEGLAEFRDRVHADAGPIDVLVNNAGTVFGGSFLDVPLAKHLKTYEVNTLGLVAMTHTFLPDLISRPAGHVVNVASASGFIGLPFGSTYASSKWSVIGFSESIRLELKELGHRHVRVTTVCPSYVSTGLFAGAKAPRTTDFMSADSLAEKVVKAVERDRPFLLVPWLVHLSPFMSGILPTSLLDRMAKWFGIHTTMQSWRGHEPAVDEAEHVRSHAD